MAVSLNINTDNDQLNQKQRFNIEGRIYILRTYFNSRKNIGDPDRSGGWYIGLYDVDDVAILTGLKLLPNRDMFFRSSDTTIFTGSIFCVDTIDDNTDSVLDLDNFGQGKRYQLWYFTREELDDFNEDQ